MLDRSLGEVLERPLHVGEEPIRVGAVHHAVVVGHGYHSHGADRDRVHAVGQRDDLGTLLDRADPEDRRLRLSDDRGAGVGSEHAGIGDGEGAALDLVGRQLLGPAPLPHIADRARQSRQRQLVRALHHRDDQPPIERHRDPDVHVLAVDDAVARDRRVHDGVFPQVLGARFRDEREVREVHTALRVGRLVFAAQLGDATVIDLEEAGARWAAATGGAMTAAALGAFAAALSVSITATSVCTGTVCPSCTLISASTPACGAGISASTLSVEISNSGSSRFTSSPSCLSHLLSVPSAIDSPIWGINTSIRAMQSPQYAASHRAALTISSVCGSTKSSSVGAYGRGTSCAVTRMIGPSSHSKACSLMRAAISPAMPPVRVSSCTITTLFVFWTVRMIAASSIGNSVRRSSTSTDRRSSLASCSAASSAFHTVAP